MLLLHTNTNQVLCLLLPFTTVGLLCAPPAQGTILLLKNLKGFVDVGDSVDVDSPLGVRNKFVTSELLKRFANTYSGVAKVHILTAIDYCIKKVCVIDNIAAISLSCP